MTQHIFKMFAEIFYADLDVYNPSRKEIYFVNDFILMIYCIAFNAFGIAYYYFHNRQVSLC